MATSAGRHPAGRTALTRVRILEAALELVDREGSEALTMRRLGDELGVAAMSLYNHVAGRDALLDGLSEVMVGQIGGARAADDPPEEVLRRFAHGIRAVALSHPEAFRLVGMRPLHTQAALRPVDAALAALRVMGLSGDRAVYAYRALVGYARGFALAEIAGFTLEDSSATPPGMRARELDPEAFPHVVAVAEELAEPDRDATFAFGLEALLAGISVIWPGMRLNAC